jgi:hypothetical protein
MSQKYTSFIDEVWSNYPALSKRETIDETELKSWSLDEYISAGYINFRATKKTLYRLSIMLENFAVKNTKPLLATFESESLYKYVEDRYVEILKKVPKTWIIGNFNNPFLAQKLPNTVEVISCVGTNISDMWIVITKRSTGVFGLVAEDVGDNNFRGFFSISPMVIKKTIENICTKLKVDIDLSK